MMIVKNPMSGRAKELAFRNAVRTAMGLLGWLVAEDASVVRAQDQGEEEALPTLPYELIDPTAVLDQATHNARLRQRSCQLTTDPCYAD
jgi:hypothetical protein